MPVTLFQLAWMANPPDTRLIMFRSGVSSGYSFRDGA